jgi:hypothetical protein
MAAVRSEQLAQGVEVIVAEGVTEATGQLNASTRSKHRFGTRDERP